MPGKTAGNLGLFFILYSITAIRLGETGQPVAENELIANCSNGHLISVPTNVSSGTTTLDLSHNNISQLQPSDLRSLVRLRVLLLSHNTIRHLDANVFHYNEALEHLDLSYNLLEEISCYPLGSLRHLDLSFNNFHTVPVCPEFGSLPHLEFLGLSGEQMRKSDFQKIAHLPLNTVFLNLNTPIRYEEGSLPVLNPAKLHIVLPGDTDSLLILKDGMKTSKIFELSNLCLLPSCNTQQNPLPETLRDSKTTQLSLSRINTAWKEFLRILQFVWHSSVRHLHIRNVTFNDYPNSQSAHFDYLGTAMRAITVEQVHVQTFTFPQDLAYQLFTKMDIDNLTLSDAQMPHMVFPKGVRRFRYVNFSNNALTDAFFNTDTRFPALETLALRRNMLTTLSVASSFAAHTPLKFIDLSENHLQHRDDTPCFWPETLVAVNFSSNKLADSVFGCLPKNIQVLDLQNNEIRSVPREMADLKGLLELNIGSNFLTDLPGCGRFNSLAVLNIEMNLILTPSLDFFQSCSTLKSVKAGNNPFRCSCELRDFIHLEKRFEGLMVGWAESYRCQYPSSLKGTLLRDVHLSELACNVPLLVGTVLVILLVMVAAGMALCLYMDVPWYLRMTWQWAQTRRRARQVPPTELERMAQFHVFVSYSERDASWVKAELIPNLESAAVSVCLHERNFVPGKSVVENIISCIEKSRKSIFVLSPHFIQSEWCHYELCFAHHQLFQEGSDGLILIVLAPIPRHSIPARYHKLKSLMAQKTYLEWPRERSKQLLFWANLRAAVNVHLPKSIETDGL
ncbi:toll-like receptor 10 [Tachyglossus aculeatus]|uniref:toll-like receptor 10 n=1 Tax=Tachyglossus aculeatus TaxID=9261 RepID=UPI0018F56992|nr:toll-like receptor 10 [Tachyglossus aculeatus]